jgi:isoleucyl-tRNA synthetase
VTRQVLLPIWNAYSFFTLYANAEGRVASTRTDSEHVLDRYLLAKTRELIEATTERMESYDLPGAAGEIQGFIDALNNWYIRRSRDRFWGTGDSGVDEAAFDTLYTVLTTLCRVAAPFLPMIMEEIYGGLTGGESVHLVDWPDADAEGFPADHALVARMDRLRDVASTALRLREDASLRVRLPLASVTVAGTGAEDLASLVDLLQDEINVKKVDLTDDIEGHATFVLKPDGKVLGPKLGKDVQAVFGAARSGAWSLADDGTVSVAGHTLQPEEFELASEAREGFTAAALRSNDAVVVLDTELTPALESEGLARDVVRLVQNARKAEDLVVTDRIELSIVTGSDAVRAAIEEWGDYITEQVLAASLSFVDSADGAHLHETDLNGAPFSFSLKVT